MMYRSKRPVPSLDLDRVSSGPGTRSYLGIRCMSMAMVSPSLRRWSSLASMDSSHDTIPAKLPMAASAFVLDMVSLNHWSLGMRRRRITSATSAAFPMPLAEPPTVASSMAERIMPSARSRMS